MQSPDEPVPVYSSTGALLWFWLAGQVEHNGNLRIVRTRRGRITRAYLRSDDGDLTAWLEATGRWSGYDTAFLQHLDGWVCWALRGVRGSR